MHQHLEVKIGKNGVTINESKRRDCKEVLHRGRYELDADSVEVVKT